MTPGSIAYLLAGLVGLPAGKGRAAKAPAVDAWVAFANGEVAFAHIAFPGDQEFEITVRELKSPRILRFVT